MLLLFAFDDFKQEQGLIGRMLMAYTELEFEIGRLIGHAIPGDTAPRIIFRVNGEAARLAVADAILRPLFEKMGLSGQWANALGALRYCKNVRNQYAHCHWVVYPKTAELCFINLDKDVISPDGILNVNLYPTDLVLLQRQYQFFEHASNWLWYLLDQCRRRDGLSTLDATIPKSVSRPPLHNQEKILPPEPTVETTPEERPAES